MTATLRAVDYLRVSTEQQKQGYGISYSAKKTAKYIEGKGWTHVDTFKDEGVSGSLSWQERDDLPRLMKLARQEPRPFDIVVVNETRAIGRTDRAFSRWVWELQDLGIYVAVVDKNIDNTTEEGEAQMREEANYAFKEYTRIRVRTQSGIQEKAEEGGHPGGTAPYGWRIKDQGKKGESCLALDVCPADVHCTAAHETDALERAWHLIVMTHKNRRQAALALNAEGFRNRSGGLWTEGNLARVLTSRAVQHGEMIYRNPASAGKSNGTKLGLDGQPANGQTVVIKLPRVFSESEVARLNKAMARNSRPRRADSGSGVHPLSTRLFGSCGKYYTGLDRCDRPGRMYRCTGKIEAYPGAKVCTCSQMDADALETRVWGEVCALLQDPNRLTAMAMDWLDMATGQQGNHIDRIVDLDKKIESQDDAIANMMIVAAKSNSPAAVSKAIKALEDEREELVRLRAEAQAWQKEGELAQQRAHDLQSLADLARTRMREMTAQEKAEVCDLLDLKVTMAGPVPKKTRADDTLTAWFRERGRGVPVLDDRAWEAVRALFEGSEVRKRADRLPHRQVLEAVLLKARTGQTWKQLPEEYGKTTGITTRYRRWVASGLFEQAMDALAGGESTPLPDLYPLPPLLVEGKTDPRILVRVPAEPEATVTRARVTSQGNSYAAVSR
ncbi:recombinase family protein [Streptomyces sp. NBC_00103]|uniref:recombinase family protein n=1 Tax=Streptomyces sp. NBC_00103 TaxID=2975653 RepID=UPI00224FCFB5|nr:recombinase family protein [Streptomyces sp. NBC_00103]MCX5374175.1 recombinase family protein [Streptomyces sp. NBC_00103]